MNNKGGRYGDKQSLIPLSGLKQRSLLWDRGGIGSGIKAAGLLCSQLSLGNSNKKNFPSWFKGRWISAVSWAKDEKGLKIPKPYEGKIKPRRRSSRQPEGRFQGFPKVQSPNRLGDFRNERRGGVHSRPDFDGSRSIVSFENVNSQFCIENGG